MHRFIGFLFCLLLVGQLPGQLANRPPSPLWLSGGELSRQFEVPERLLKAILLVAAPEDEVRVLINQRQVASVAVGRLAVSVDVTPHLKPGLNQIQFKCSARVAALLELNGDLAQTTWLATDKLWSADQQHGPADAVADANPFDLKKTHDAYNSWKLASREEQPAATAPAAIQVPEGYRVELIRSAAADEDSWVSMAFDAEGRIYLGQEKKGILCLHFSRPDSDAAPEVSDVRQINDSLAECRGLLWMDGWLYAHANRSKKLVRLRDTRGDGSFETEQTLLETGGGYGHGRNHIKPGPDGRLWVVQGNNVLLPAELSADSPLQFYAEDQLLPNPWDGSLFDGDVQLPAGHILSMNPDGSDVQLVAGGLRNPLDLAFNRAGHAFTFDADMERDLGSAWYMPTRVLQIVPGADYGWRRGTGRWPAAFPDSLPSVVDIGLASPTAVFFGYGAAFPKRDEEALFICDWSYGRIIAVRLQAFGEGYRATQESFITGRPLNVTDGAIGPDGALWFITGGRSTQSGLYRVSYHGSGVQDTAQPAPEPRSVAPTLDPFAQHRLRMELEKTGRPPPGITALSSALATARTGTEAQRLQLLEEILEGAFTGDPDWLRVLEVTLCRLGWSGLEGGLERLPTVLRQRLVERLEPHFPHPDDTGLNHQLLKFLVYLRSPGVIEKAVAHLAQASSSEDLLFYPMILRYLKSSEQWTEEGYRTVFTGLNAAEKLRGASSYFKAIADTRGEFATALRPEVMTRLADVVSPPQPASLTAHALPAHTFKQWTLADLEPLLPKVGQGRSYEGAKKALVTAQCVACHRVSADNSLPAGILGPDLSQVSARFGRRDLLLHTLEPSLAIDEKYRLLTVTQKDGSSVTGTLESEDDERITLRPNPLDQASIEIGKSLIVKREEAPISPMPAGLLNSLKAEQILDLLAWFEANGQNDPRIFY